MKTKTEARHVTTATSESRDFTIKANGKAFKILIDGLYENKVQSIVREIWSNALDSHVEAGHPERPFAVTFPSMYNPTFTVRDFGTSLSHEDVMGLYSTVFESTKEDTNTAVGKFGLGSKSPFAYTDTFTVTAFMDGKKRVYSALISEDGVPQIHFMGEFDTDEERGIEVMFPIETRDINAFRKAALRVSHGFDIKPDVIQKSDDDDFNGWPELEILGEGDGWKLLSGCIEGYSQQAYAKMGCVLYPINVNAITDLNSAERKLLQSTMVIDFPVGDLEINASREALSYGPKDPTVDSIRMRIRTIVQEMVQTFVDQYAAASTYWEACILFREHINSGSLPEAVKEHLKKHAMFDGKLLSMTQTVGTQHTCDVTLPNNHHIQVCTIAGSKLSNAVYRFDYITDRVGVPARKDIVIFVEDLESDVRIKHVPGKIREAQRDEDFDTIVWVKYKGGREAAQAMVELLDTFDGADVRDVADLPDMPKNSAGGNGHYIKRPVQVRIYSAGRFDQRADLQPDDFAKGGFYVPLERNNPKYPSGMGFPGDVWAALRAFGENVIPQGTVLHGAPKSLWKHFEGDQWVNIYDLAAATFKKHQPKKQIAKARMIERVLGDDKLRFINQKLSDGDFAESSIIRDALTLYQEAATAKKPAVDHIVRLAGVVGQRETVEKWADVEFPELDVIRLELDDRYPLLESFDNWYMRDALDKLAHYVHVCDKAAELDSLRPLDETAAIAA